MNDAIAHGVSLLATLAIGAILIAVVGLVWHLAWAAWIDRAERRGPIRRHPSSRMNDLLRQDAREARSREAWHRLGGHDRVILSPAERDAIADLDREIGR